MTERLRILIVRLGAMGDVIHALPSALALRRALPNCELGWVIEQRWLPLLCAPDSPLVGQRTQQRPLVERIHPVDTRGWRKRITQPGTWREVLSVARDLRATNYHIAIDIQGAIKSAVLASVSRAPIVWGFTQPRESIARIAYTRTHDPRATHIVDQNTSLVAAAIRVALGQSTWTLRGQAQFVFPVDPRAECWATKEIERLGSGRVAIINPGAGWGAKCWPAASYAEVARWLRARGIVPLINFGPGEESLAEEVQRQAPGSELLQATLSQLIAVTRRASLFVGGDTGPMHLAAGLGVPTVALFGPTDPARNGPYSDRSVVLRSEQSQTSYSHVRTADDGLLSITAAEAIAAAEKVLEF